MTNEEKTISKETKVSVKKQGIGVVEQVSQQDSDDGAYSVYHVRFENGDVRHFTASELKEVK